MDKTYQCELCEQKFESRQSYWYHKNRSKKLCIPKDKVLEQLTEQKNKLNYYQNKNEKQAKEIVDLKDRIQFLESIKTDINEIKDTIKEQNIVYNFNNINSQNVNAIGNIFNIQMAEKEKERLDHISHEMLLKILEVKKFEVLLAQLIRAIYFNPKAPENMRWCITDKNAKNGAIEYNRETNSLSIKGTKKVINDNIQNVMGRICDLIEELQKQYKFSKTQFYNSNKLFSIFATEINAKCLDNVKNMAYVEKNLPKALWQHLNVNIDTPHFQIKIN